MKRSNTIRNIVPVILVVTAATLFLSIPAPLRVVFSFLQAYYLPGFVFLLYFGDPRRPRLDDLFLPLVISPILIAAFVLGLYQFTGSLTASIRGSLILFYIFLVTAYFRRGKNHAEAPRTMPISLLLISTAACGIVVASYLINRYLLVYADAWHHASVTYEILDRGVPPLDPRFPDIAIRYMWIYHLFQAIWKELSGLDVFTVLGVFNAVVAFSFPYLAARLTAQFKEERRYILTTPIFAFLGIQAASWVLWPIMFVQSLFGTSRGMEEISRNLDRIELNGAEVIHFLTPARTWLMSMLDKFLTITALHYTLNLFLLCFIIVVGKDILERSRQKAALIIFVTMIGAFLFHVVTGLSLILTAIGGSIILYLFTRLVSKSTPPLLDSIFVPAIAVIALFAGLRYFISLTGGEGSGNLIRDHLHFGDTNLFTIVAPLVALLPFSWSAMKKTISSDKIEYRTLAAWAASLFVLSIFADLPGIAENKIVFPLLLLLALPISWEIVDRIANARGVRRVLLYVWMVVLFIVPSVLTVRGFMLERPETTHFEKRINLTDQEREIFDWIRNNTEIDAVVIERNTYNLMPVHARRRNFILQPTFIHVHHYGGEKVKRYLEIHDEFFSTRPITEESIKYLKTLANDFYIVLWREDIETDPSLEDKFLSRSDWFLPCFKNSQGVIYQLIK